MSIDEAYKREIERLIKAEKEDYEAEDNETGKAHIWFTIQALEAALTWYNSHELVEGCTVSLAGEGQERTLVSTPAAETPVAASPNSDYPQGGAE